MRHDEVERQLGAVMRDVLALNGGPELVLRVLDQPLVASAVAPRGTNIAGHIERMAAGSRATSGPEVNTSAAQSFYGVTVTAASSARGIIAGAPLRNSTELGELMAESLRQMAPDGTPQRRQKLVAKATWEYPPERQLGIDSEVNSQRIESVCGLSAPRVNRQTGALTASGGVCLPTGVAYDVPVFSTAERPLRDGLPGFQATRGGITFMTPPDIGVPSLQGTASGAGLATGIWTEATDASPGSSTKPVWQIACGSPQTVYVDAIPARGHKSGT